MDLGSKVTDVEIFGKNPVVQCKVLEALAKGGCSALDVVTKVVPPSNKPSCTTSGGDDADKVSYVDNSQLEAQYPMGVLGWNLILNPYQLDPTLANKPPIYSPSNNCGELIEDSMHEVDFKVV